MTDELTNTELLKKVNDLSEMLFAERTSRARLEKAAAVKAKWNSFADDGKVDLDSVLWTLDNYKPPEPKPDAKTNDNPPPTGQKAKLRTPNGLVDAATIPESMRAIRASSATTEDSF